jgi:site-specific DNA-cytosine methylase
MQPIALDTYNQTINRETTQTIRANTSTEHIGAVIVPKAAAFSVAKGAQSRTIGYREENAPTLVADTGNSHAVMHPTPVLAGEHPQKGVSIAQPIAVDWRTAQVDIEKTGTLKTDLAKMSGPCIAVENPTVIDRAAFNQGLNAQYEPRIEASETMSSLVAKGPHAVAQPIAVDVYNQKTTGDKFGVVREQHGTNMNAVLQPMAFDWQSGGDMRGMNLQEKTQLQRCQTPAVLHSMAIRRLTPKECERLQGFPDDWTKIPYRNKPIDQCPDGPRYKACGNSMAVNVMHWIGKRISYIEELTK